MQIIAHRGASKVCEENTVDAFLRAHEMGADGVELDVQETLDGVLVVRHDTFDKRTGVFTFEMVYDKTDIKYRKTFIKV